MDIIKINWKVQKYRKDLIALALRPMQFKVHTNPQGWLPPAALTGCGGRGRGQPYAFILLYILTAAGSEQTQHPLRTHEPPETHASARHRKAPASPHTTRAVGADREGHPGGVKARGGRRESRRRYGAGIH